MTTFTLTSCNARWGLDRHDRPFPVAEVIERFGTDVIAVQEWWEPADGSGPLLPAAARLGYEVLEVPLSGSFVDPQPEITAHPHEAAGTWGVALLTRVPVVGVRRVDLGRAVERWDVAERQTLLVDLAVPGAHQPVTVVPLHLSFALPNAVAQLRRLRGLLPTDRPSVVVGDCNLWGPLAARLLGGRRRAVRGRTWPAHRPHSQLDHILLDGPVTASHGRVLPPVGSDHLPVQATLTLAS